MTFKLGIECGSAGSKLNVLPTKLPLFPEM